VSGYEVAEDARRGIASDRRRVDEFEAMPDEQLFRKIVELEGAVEDAVNEVRDRSDTLVRAVGVALERWMPETVAEKWREAGSAERQG